MHNIFPIDIAACEHDAENPLNEEIMSSILQRTVVAAADALVKDLRIGGCRILTNLDKKN